MRGEDEKHESSCERMRKTLNTRDCVRGEEKYDGFEKKDVIVVLIDRFEKDDDLIKGENILNTRIRVRGVINCTQYSLFASNTKLL